VEQRDRATKTEALTRQPCAAQLPPPGRGAHPRRAAVPATPWPVALLGLLLLFAAATPHAATHWPSAQPDYPLPPDDPALLFFLQRSMNPNTVVYAARLDARGRLDDEQPVEAFWLRFNTDGKRRELNFIERLLAYGVRSETHPDEPGRYITEIVGFGTRPFVVDLDATGRPRATVQINGRPARLASIYLQLDETSSWPKVDAIELRGTDRVSGERVMERFVP